MSSCTHRPPDLRSQRGVLRRVRYRRGGRLDDRRFWLVRPDDRTPNYDRPVRSGALGFGAIGGGFVGFIVPAFALLLLAEAGLPEPVDLLGMIPFLLGTLFVYVGVTLGMIVIGAFLLRRVRGGEANRWLAVVVGALVVNIPGLNLVLAFVALFAGTGAMVDHLWQRRRGGSAGPKSQQPIDG